MKLSIGKGFSFGLTSGIITTLGLIIGLHSSTNSVIVIIGGILVIAIADSMSDALGIHMSQEFENKNSTKEVWESTIATFLSKFVFALMFIIPLLLFELLTAIIVCIIIGLSLIAIFSYYIARRQKIKAHKIILEHLLIAIVVIITTHYIGDWVATLE